MFVPFLKYLTWLGQPLTDVFHHKLILSLSLLLLWFRQDGGVFVRVQLLCFLLKTVLQRLVMRAGLDESDRESGETRGYSEYKRNETQWSPVWSHQLYSGVYRVCEFVSIVDYFNHFFFFLCVCVCVIGKVAEKRKREWVFKRRRERDYCTSGYSIFYLDISLPDSSELSTALSALPYISVFWSNHNFMKW